jgi:phage terminase Nu1 subunit (DNA packaging protein)
LTGVLVENTDVLTAGAVEELLVDVGALMALTGVSKQFIGELAKDGVVIKGGRGIYVLAQSIRNYIDSLRDRQKTLGDGDTEINAAKELALLRQKQRELTQIKIDVETGKLVRVDHAVRLYSELAHDVKTTFLAMPTRMAQRLEGQSEAYIYRALHDEVYFILEKLSAPVQLVDTAYMRHIEDVEQKNSDEVDQVDE